MMQAAGRLRMSALSITTREFSSHKSHLKKRYFKGDKLPKKVIEKQNRSWRIVTGDMVIPFVGKDKNKPGKVIKVRRSTEQLTIENFNIQKVNKLSPTGEEYQVDQEVPVHYSDVMLIDPADGKPTRCRFGYLEDGTKVRIAVRSGEIIPWPKLEYVKDTTVYPTDTPADAVLEKTYLD